jgi:hypothetical protein
MIIELRMEVGTAEELFSGTAAIVYRDIEIIVVAYNVTTLPVSSFALVDTIDAYKTASVSHLGLVNDRRGALLNSR